MQLELAGTGAEAEPRQPHRRVRRGRATCRRRGRRATVAGQRSNRRQSRSAGGQACPNGRSSAIERPAAGRRPARPVRDPRRASIQAVRGVSFGMRPATTLALVGESGSGKSVVSQSIMRILPRTGQDHPGRDPVRRPAHFPSTDRLRASCRPGRRQDAVDPRRPHLDHLPGADDLAVAAAHRRQPGRRGARLHRDVDSAEATRADGRDAAAGRLSRPEARGGAPTRSSCPAVSASAR